MNRRDFLQPRRLAATAGEIVGAVDELQEAARGLVSPPVATPGPEFALMRFSRQAMATTFEVLVPFATPGAREAAEDVLDEIDRLEAQLTVYRDTSEVSRLNRAALYSNIPVEEGLFRLLQLAARISAETENAYDISAGALVKAWGFFRGPPRVPSDEELARARVHGGMGHVVLDPERQTVRFLRRGLEINLGSIGKGYALDRTAAILRHRWNLSPVLLHGGRSSLYALGTEPGNERGWAVSLTHPWHPERQLALLRLRDLALGTSAATFRYLEHEGRKLGHILDPRTGWPAEGVASVSVVAATAAEADALATAFYVMGLEKTRAYCETHPDVGAVLLPEGEAALPVFLGLARNLVDPSLT